MNKPMSVCPIAGPGPGTGGMKRKQASLSPRAACIFWGRGNRSSQHAIRRGVVGIHLYGAQSKPSRCVTGTPPEAGGRGVIAASFGR